MIVLIKCGLWLAHPLAIVLSDVYIGNNANTVWYQKPIHEQYLVTALNLSKCEEPTLQKLNGPRGMLHLRSFGTRDTLSQPTS